jgi:hypothetical protein
MARGKAARTTRLVFSNQWGGKRVFWDGWGVLTVGLGDCYDDGASSLTVAWLPGIVLIPIDYFVKNGRLTPLGNSQVLVGERPFFFLW